MPPSQRAMFFIACVVAMSSSSFAQAPNSTSRAQPDVLIFVDGEKLIGHLEHATGSSVVFKSDVAGEVTVEWSKIQELRSSQRFAVIPKDVKLRRSPNANTVPQGTVTMRDQKLQVQTTAAARSQAIPVGNVGNLVDETSFQEAFRKQSFTQGWKGGATAGLSLTQATQTSQAFTASANFTRAVPNVNWLDLRSRTIFDYNQAYGKTSTPGSPSIKTSLFRIDGEQDWYLSHRLYTFVGAAFDHNFSQGLSLQQTYGGGVGLVVFKTDIQEFDVKASMDYINQRFQTSTLNKNLIGSIFGESYSEKFVHGILFNEQAGVTPAWNDSSAYSAFASAGLTFPVYHRLGLTLGALDSYLNDPPPSFKKNSFQFTVGATYSFQ
ncbi:MAG: DUF481 domain-containing protein [Bryobacteraceae bacterium]